MGLSVFIPTGDNHGDPLISPFCNNITCQFCRSVAHRTYTEDFCSFARPISGPPCEVAESLGRGSRFVGREACAYQRYSHRRTPYRSVGEGHCIIFRVERISRIPASHATTSSLSHLGMVFGSGLWHAKTSKSRGP